MPIELGAHEAGAELGGCGLPAPGVPRLSLSPSPCPACFPLPALRRASSGGARTALGPPKSDDQIIRGKNPHIGESRILAPEGPGMQAAASQCLVLQIAAASPDPQTRAFPGTHVSRKTRLPDKEA